MPRRTADAAARTRDDLLLAGRRLFAARGFDAVSADELAAEAGVTRGALNHHFGDKRGLFEAVYLAELERLDEEVSEAGRTAAAAAGEVWPALEAGLDRYLDLCLDPEVGALLLVHSPAALGWQRWDELDRAFSVAQLTGVLEVLVATGELDPAPVLPLAEVLVGALNQIGRLVALAPPDGRAQVRAELGDVLHRLLAGLRRTRP